MSNTRPSLARVHTPGTEKRRSDTLDQGLSLTIDDDTYTVRAGDLTALDAQALRKQLGLSFTGLLNAMSTDPDIDLVAGVVWLSRRVAGERTLTYVEVAGEMRYDVVDSIVLSGADGVDDEAGSPEASGGSS